VLNIIISTSLVIDWIVIKSVKLERVSCDCVRICTRC